MKDKTLKTWSYLFILVGVGNFLMLVDVLLSDGEKTHSIFSIPASREMNAAFYGLMSCFLIFAGVYQNGKLNNRKKQE